MFNVGTALPDQCWWQPAVATEPLSGYREVAAVVDTHDNVLNGEVVVF